MKHLKTDEKGEFFRLPEIRLDVVEAKYALKNPVNSRLRPMPSSKVTLSVYEFGTVRFNFN